MLRADDLICPRCGCEDFTAGIEFNDDIVVHVDTCNECGLAFDGEEWSDDGEPFELTHGT